MNKVSSFIASTGQNIQFVAFFAHFFTAAYIVSRFHGDSRIALFGVIVVVAAIKEYVFDARDELNPPQTFLDNTEDFLGWSLGAALGLMS